MLLGGGLHSTLGGRMVSGEGAAGALTGSSSCSKSILIAIEHSKDGLATQSILV